MEAVVDDDYDAASSAVDQMPPGFRFHPTDSEIIDYLLNKVIDTRFRAVAIGEINLNICEPWDLPKKSKNMEENEWFFFFEKEAKYPSGIRTNRATPSGYWKATGKDKEIFKKRQVVGMKKTLVFYKGRAPKGDKTNWVIHEYRLHGDNNLSNHAKEKWVVCRVFHKKNGVNIDPIPSAAVQLGRVDSFVDRYLLDSPTPLPPLTDYSSSSSHMTHHDHQKPSSTFTAHDEDQLDRNNYFFESPNYVAINSNYNQYYSTNLNPNPYYSTQMVHLNSVPNQNGLSSSTSSIQRYPIPIKGADDGKPNSRILESDIFIGGKEPERIIMYKMEGSELSRESELDCNKLESESKQCDDEENLCFSPNISDIDSIWS